MEKEKKKMSGGREREGNNEGRKTIVAALSLILTFTLTGLFISASVSSTSAGVPGFPLVTLYGNLTYADGSPAPNVEVTVKNETSGISLPPATTNKEGLWIITIFEGSQIGGCGDEVLIYARDAWNNEVSKRVNIICDEDRLQSENLAFEVPKPTTTPSPSPSPSSSGAGGSGSSGGDVTPTPTPTPTSTPVTTATSPSPSPISETESDTSQSEAKPEPELEGNANLSILLVVGVGIVALLALVMLLVYRYKYKKD